MTYYSKNMKRIEKLQKKQVQMNPIVIEAESKSLTSQYLNEIDNNPEYSLKVDPTNKYNMSDQQKEFISHYVQHKNIPVAAKLANIDVDVASQMYAAYSSQQEIRRINRALYHRQFAHKLLSVDDIGGWLSSLITDEDVPYADRLKPREKLQVAQMLLNLNEWKRQVINNPEMLTTKDIETEIKQLSIETIKNMLSTKNQIDNEAEQKTNLINEIKKTNTLSIEELSLLETLSVSELLDLLNTSEKGE